MCSYEEFSSGTGGSYLHGPQLLIHGESGHMLHLKDVRKQMPYHTNYVSFHRNHEEPKTEFSVWEIRALGPHLNVFYTF